MSLPSLSHQNQPTNSPPSPSLHPTAEPAPASSPPTTSPQSHTTTNIHPPASPSEPPPTIPPEPPPTFTPFFTLLTTAPNLTTHHPTTHYIFSSDPADTTPLTAALLDETHSPLSSPSASTTPHSPKERYILLDLDASGTRILSAQSLSPEWAVTATELAPAPTWEGEGGGGGVMLRIEGVEADGFGGEGEKGLEELVEGYERGMEALRRVVDQGGMGDEGLTQG